MSGQYSRPESDITGTVIVGSVVVSASALPTGASTSAKQPNFSTAGSPSTDVLTVQGITGMTPLNIFGNVASGATDSGNPVKVGGIYNLVLPTFTDGQRADLQVDANGKLLVSGSSPISAGVTDKSSFTYGTSLEIVVGGVYQDTAPTVTAGQSGGLRMTQYRGLQVNLRDSSGNELLGSKTSANSIPVVIASDQGAVPASQSGTWNITNISGTVSLPTGAATAAKQPALGTAGTASADVLTVQGIASMTALKVDGSGSTQPISGTVTVNPLTNSSIVKAQLQDNAGAAVILGQTAMSSSLPVAIASNQSAIPVSQSGSWTVTANAGTNLNTSALALDASVSGILVSQGSTTSGEKGPLIQGAVTTAAPSYTTAQTNPLSLTTAGALRVDASGSTQPVSGTVAATQSGTWNITNVSGTVSLPTGASTAANQTTANTSLNNIDVSTADIDAKKTSVATATPTISTSAYTSGYQMGGILTFANMVRVSGSTAVMMSVQIVDGSKQNAQLSLFLFNASPTITSSDQQAFAMTTANLKSQCIGTVEIAATNYSSLSANSIATVAAIAMPYKLAATSLFGVLVSRGTPTYASSSDIQITMEALQD